MLSRGTCWGVGGALASARWLLAIVGVIVTGVWLGKRLGRYLASHDKF